MDYAKFKDYEDYIVFMNGKIYSLKRNRFLKPNLDKSTGYYRVELTKNKIGKKFRLHRILAICFLKNPDNLPTIDHIDINPQNNNLSNLRWSSSRLQNINKNIQKSNKTGVKGVCFDKSRNCYVAKYSINYKDFQKSFSANKYPNAKQLAIDWRTKMVELHYKDII